MNTNAAWVAGVVLLLPGCLGQGDLDHNGQVVDIPFTPLQPRLDRILEEREWKDALVVNGTFVIHDESRAAGSYPFRLLLKADDEWWFSAVVFDGLTPQPWSGSRADGVHEWRPDNVAFLMTPGWTGDLDESADFKLFQFIHGGGATSDDGYWHPDDGWILQFQVHGAWGSGDYPLSGTWARSDTADPPQFLEIALDRRPTGDSHDGVRLEGHGAKFRLAVVFVRQDDHTSGAGQTFDDPHDVWPGEGYTPHDWNHPDRWLRVMLP